MNEIKVGDKVLWNGVGAYPVRQPQVVTIAKIHIWGPGTRLTGFKEYSFLYHDDDTIYAISVTGSDYFEVK